MKIFAIGHDLDCRITKSKNLGDYQPINLLGLLIQSFFIEKLPTRQLLRDVHLFGLFEQFETGHGLGVAVILFSHCIPH